MIDSIIHRKNLESADAIILGVPFYNSYYKKEQQNGPQEVAKILDRELDFFDRFYRCEPAYMFKIGFKLLKKLGNKKTEEALQLILGEHRKIKNKFILTLGGDHSVSIAPLMNFSKDAKNITVLQIDAHPDLRKDDSDYKEKPSEYSHSTVMRHAFDFGYKTVQVGIRTYSKAEYDFIQKNKLKVFEWGVKNTPSIKSIIDSIKTKNVYLSIDIDGIDPAHMPATGTPVPGGLEWNYANELIRELFRRKNVIGADIVEIGTMKESILTQYSVAQIAYSIVSCKLLK